MEVKCPGCYTISTIFSHAQSVITYPGCDAIMAKPFGGRCKLVLGCSYRRKPGN